MKWWPDKYPSNCRQQHVGWVGYNHNDWPDDERCPVCRAMDEADALRASLAAAEANANTLRNALEWALRTLPVGCPACGDRLDEPKRIECTEDHRNMAALLAATPAASLSAHDAEVLERAIKAIAAPEGECEGLMAGEAKYGDPYTPGFNDGLRSARDSVRALAAQEVKP